jgi:hypothetical protein
MDSSGGAMCCLIESSGFSCLSFIYISSMLGIWECENEVKRTSDKSIAAATSEKQKIILRKRIARFY